MRRQEFSETTWRLRGGFGAGLGALCLSVACGASAAPIRNVILCIGDGMGTGQVAAAGCYAGTNLFFESFPFRSLMTTAAEGEPITDSAAASTALATGRKVNTGIVSLAVPGDASDLDTLLEYYKRLGKSTGLVTTSYLTDATPACFAAHALSRYDSAQIASDYLTETRPEVMLGGGSAGLGAATVASAGYAVVTDRASLAALSAALSPRVCGLFGWAYLPYEYDGLGAMPSLSDMTAKALDVLSRDPDGFFLMVEGGLIDIACHGNDLPRCVGETLAFGAAVKRIAEWAEGRGDTLILVTSDHETGGLAVTHDNGPGVLPDVTWASSYHTDAPVAVYGWGVNAHRVTQVTDNTEVRQVTCSEAPMPATGFCVERLAEGVTRTHWAVSSGDVCRVEYTPQLRPLMWQSLGTVTAASTRVTCVATNQVPNGKGFFRMVTEPGEAEQ